MTYVIAEPCIKTKDTACVEVCPVDCIHPTKDDKDAGLKKPKKKSNQDAAKTKPEFIGPRGHQEPKK